MRKKAENSVSKNKILIEAFKLFASKPFDKVTFADLENATGLSRGAILYHVKTKENLFNMTLDELIFKRTTIAIAPNTTGLWDHIEVFIQERIDEQEYFASLGIANINKAFMNVECSAFAYSTKMQEFSTSWLKRELEYWTVIFDNAIATGEILKSVEPILDSNIFLNIFMGASYIGASLLNGYDLLKLKEEYRILYDRIKNDK